MNVITCDDERRIVSAALQAVPTPPRG